MNPLLLVGVLISIGLLFMSTGSLMGCFIIFIVVLFMSMFYSQFQYPKEEDFSKRYTPKFQPVDKEIKLIYLNREDYL